MLPGSFFYSCFSGPLFVNFPLCLLERVRCTATTYLIWGAAIIAFSRTFWLGLFREHSPPLSPPYVPFGLHFGKSQFLMGPCLVFGPASAPLWLEKKLFKFGVFPLPLLCLHRVFYPFFFASFNFVVADPRIVTLPGRPACLGDWTRPDWSLPLFVLCLVVSPFSSLILRVIFDFDPSIWTTVYRVLF